jgi:CBS domain containing-hemolysin-like protein
VQVSREEVAAVADMGLAGGSLTPGEARAIRNLLALRNVRVTDIMTPRPVVQYVQADQTIGEYVASARHATFARMPVVDDDIDHVLGVIHRSMILEAVRAGDLSRTFRQMARPIGAVPEPAPAAEALEKVLKQREQMLLVVDEYGGTAGVVTLEDIVETLLGVEIVDETDPTVDMRELARKLQQQRLSENAERETPLSEAK